MSTTGRSFNQVFILSFRINKLEIRKKYFSFSSRIAVGLIIYTNMAVAFTNISWWLWSGKHQDPKTPNRSSLYSSSDLALWESDAIKFPLANGSNIRSSSKRAKRKWQSQEERKIDREYDVVLVPSDGGCVSGSESDDSDWSVGWLEPHGPGFQSDDDLDDSFAVLVPCYGRGRIDTDKDVKKLQGTIGVVPDIYASETNKYLEQWISALQSS